MANAELIVRGVAIVIGLLFGATGTFILLAPLGDLGDGAVWMDGRWVGIAGLAFILGGLGAIVSCGIAGGVALEDDKAFGSLAAGVSSVALWAFVLVSAVSGVRRLARRR